MQDSMQVGLNVCIAIHELYCLGTLRYTSVHRMTFPRLKEWKARLRRGLQPPTPVSFGQTIASSWVHLQTANMPILVAK